MSENSDFIKMSDAKIVRYGFFNYINEIRELLEQEKSRSNRFRLSLDDKIQYIEQLEDEIKKINQRLFTPDVCDNCSDCERSIQCKDTY